MERSKNYQLLFILLAYPICQSYMIENDTTAMLYLERFGYLETDDMAPGMGMKEAQPMLLAFQKMCGIDQTGELDNKTMAMMNAPRCGNKDMMRIPINETEKEAWNGEGGYLNSNRLKRYTINQQNRKWRKSKVTYKMGMFSEEMQKHVTKKQVLTAVHQAFQLWSEVTNLDFSYVPHQDRVDIELSFTTRNHPQDMFPFDGPGSVLAHAFAPGDSLLDGDVHFEDGEDWRVNSPKGTDVLFVAVHEIGHALGLSHSSTKGAIMAAFYGGYRPKLALHPDDIAGIQALYGKRDTTLKAEPIKPPKVDVIKPFTPPATTPTTTTTTRKTTTTARTTTSRKTTTTKVPTTTTTFRTTQKSWISSSTTPLPSTPKWNDGTRPPKRPDFQRPDLCDYGSIDAITTLNDGKIYVFKGSYVFQIEWKSPSLSPSLPHHIGFIFPGLETDIDAVATRENGRTYFFKGEKYWRYIGRKMEPGYPKLMTKHFPGIPENVDGAFVWFGQFYFIKGDKFWRFDPKSKPHVAKVYPLSTESVWGLPSTRKIDAAFTAPNGNAYFFVGSRYYKLDSRTFKVAEETPPYPRSSLTWWFGCTQTPGESRIVRFPYWNNS